MNAAANPGALDAPVAFAAPQVTEADALGDRDWFASRPDRLFRARIGDGGLWLVRRRPQASDLDVLLRTLMRTIAVRSGDGDVELAVLWYQAAYPGWPPEQTQKAARKALRKPRR